MLLLHVFVFVLRAHHERRFSIVVQIRQLVVHLRVVLLASPVLGPFGLSLLVVVVVVITVFVLFGRVVHHVGPPSSLAVQRLELLVQKLLGRFHVVALRVTVDCILTILEKLLFLRHLLRLSGIMVDALVLSDGDFVVFDEHVLAVHVEVHGLVVLIIRKQELPLPQLFVANGRLGFFDSRVVDGF